MPESEITIVKSPVVPLDLPDDNMIIYGNQVTYSVRLPNGMIITRPEEFPGDDKEEGNMTESTEEAD